MPKCEQYWADINSAQPKAFGAMRVTTLAEEPNPDIPSLTKRVCQLKLGMAIFCPHRGTVMIHISTGRGGRQHQFTQYHFTSWPDFGVPSEPGPLVELVKLVRSHDEGALQHVVVHCSAGVGRTGTFVALYNVMAAVDQRKDDTEAILDVYNTVYRLREDRTQMVLMRNSYRM